MPKNPVMTGRWNLKVTKLRDEYISEKAISKENENLK